VSFDVHEDDDQSKLFWQRIDGPPQLCGPIALDHSVLHTASGWEGSQFTLFAGRTAPFAPLAVERQAPGHPNEPWSKSAAIAEAMELTVSPDERLLRHVFRVLPMAQHGEGDAKGEPGALDQLRLELALEVCIHGHCRL
jgi:hypothetical protein